MPAKKEKGPVRIGDESSGWVHKAPDVGEGAAGIIVKKLGCSWEEANKKLGDAYGDIHAVLASAGKVRAHPSRPQRPRPPCPGLLSQQQQHARGLQPHASRFIYLFAHAFISHRSLPRSRASVRFARPCPRRTTSSSKRIARGCVYK